MGALEWLQQRGFVDKRTRPSKILHQADGVGERRSGADKGRKSICVPFLIYWPKSWPGCEAKVS